MNPVLAKVLKKGAQEAVKKAIKYIKDDQRKTYALDETVSFELEATGMGNRPAFKTKDGSLEYTPLDSDHFRVVCYPFPASARLWNGPDIIGDGNLASMAASLVHDLWWIHAEEISEAWHCGRIYTLHFGNELLNCIWLMFEPRSRMARIAFGVCEWASPWYHKLKKLVGLGCLVALLAAGAGCGLFNAPAGWRVVSAEGTNAIVRAMQSSSAEAGAKPGEGGRVPLSGMVSAEVFSANGQQVSDNPDEADFASFSWCYGGFNGGNAALSDGCRIKDLRVGGGKLFYAWVEGGCEQLGASSRTAPDCIAALFVRDAQGNWRGGKFDWISTSRTQRGFENITEHGYNGWPKDAIETATAYAFVIVSKDGRKRTNVITAGR